MRPSRVVPLRWISLLPFVGLLLVLGVGAEESLGQAAKSPGRIEVVLANSYRAEEAAIKAEFDRYGMTNVHIQYFRLGQPPPNIGIGREVPVEAAHAALQLAVKYNHSVKILLPVYLFPPHFITIASSNYDDTVEFPIDEEDLKHLQDPSLTTDSFHELYRRLTTRRK